LLTSFMPGPCLLSTKVFDMALQVSKFFLNLFSYWSPTFSHIFVVWFWEHLTHFYLTFLNCIVRTTVKGFNLEHSIAYK
jgi:hypothetical protein